MGTRNDDISLILAKAKKQGFLPDVADSEVDLLSIEANTVAKKFGNRRYRPKVAAMSTPPTVIAGATNGGSAANTAIAGSTLLDYTSSRFTYAGGFMEPFSGNASWYGQAKPVTGGGTRNIAVHFGFEGQAFEWRTNGTGQYYRIWVDGVPATNLWQTLPTHGLDVLIKVDLGSRNFYDIRLELKGGYFGGVRTAATDRIYPCKPISPLRLHIIGDSFTDGQSYSGGSATYTPGYVFRLAEHLQIEDVWGRARGGTGYLTASSSNFRSRLADCIPYNPDVILIPGSVNDTNTLPPVGAIAAEIKAIHAEVKANLPRCLIVGASVLHMNGAHTNLNAANAEMKATYAELGLPYIDLEPLNSGFGHVASTVGGSCDFNCSADGVHPEYPIGFDQLANRLAIGLEPILRSAE